MSQPSLTPRVDLSGAAWFKLSVGLIVTIATMIGTAVYTYSRIEFRVAAVEVENERQNRQRDLDHANSQKLADAINNLAREVSELKGLDHNRRP